MFRYLDLLRSTLVAQGRSRLLPRSLSQQKDDHDAQSAKKTCPLRN